MKENSFFVKFLSTLKVSSKKLTTSQDGQVSALLVEKQLQDVTYEQHCDLCFSICLECFPFISVMLFPYSPKKWFWWEFILQPLTLMEELIFFCTCLQWGTWKINSTFNIEEQRSINLILLLRQILENPLLSNIHI